jgi:4'-phosphopantetheinyl transferase EntD
LPLFYTHTIDENSRLAIWHITEDEGFFIEKVPVSRKITHPHKRLQHLAGRYLLQWLYPEFPIHLIQVADTRKPYLAEESHHFSISHSGDYAAALVSTNKRVGIDIELHTERILRVKHKFLNDREMQLEPNPPGVYPTLIWSAKEAMYKWHSTGDVDFQEHLQIKEWFPASDVDGEMETTFAKDHPVDLNLSYKIWNELVLTWICQ